MKMIRNGGNKAKIDEDLAGWWFQEHGIGETAKSLAGGLSGCCIGTKAMTTENSNALKAY